MKIINDILQEGTGATQVVEKKAPKEHHFIGSVRRHKGHILFEYNKTTGEMRKAEFTRIVEVDMEGRPHYSTKVYTRKDCIYLQAMNIENAWKKIRRGY